jgi:hypothetical protein
MVVVVYGLRSLRELSVFLDFGRQVTLTADTDSADTCIIHRGKVSPDGEKPCSNAHLFETKQGNVSDTQFSVRDISHCFIFRCVTEEGTHFMGLVLTHYYVSKGLCPVACLLLPW